MPAMHGDPIIKAVRCYYDRQADREWERLERRPAFRGDPPLTPIGFNSYFTLQ